MPIRRICLFPPNPKLNLALRLEALYFRYKPDYPGLPDRHSLLSSTR